MSKHETQRYIRLFSEIGATDVGLVGGKGANLGEMTRAGLPVPPGFCLTAEAYHAFIETTRAGDTIRGILAKMKMDSPEDVDAKAAQIRQLLNQQPVPAEIAAQALTAYRVLGRELASPGAPSIAVAVRSSATAEDLPSASFAGQQDTYLNVRGDDDLLEHIRQCWASLWTARAVTYRAQQHFDHLRVGLAVVVQAMIASEVAGILFTANPINHRRDEAVVNASWGLGEAIVSGLVTPDTWVVRKSDNAILSREIATKNVAIEYSGERGTAERAVPAERQDIPALGDNQIVELVSLGSKIENHYGAPMDIEWGYVNDKFYVLQARAITTLQELSILPSKGEYDRSMFLELLPDALSPAILSAIEPLFQCMLDFTFETMGFTPPRDIKAIGVFYNQPYFHREYIEAVFRPLRPAVRERMVAQVIQPFGKHESGMRGDWSISFLGMMARLLWFMVRFPPQLPGIVSRYRQEVNDVAALRLEGMSDREIMARIRNLVFGTVSRLLNYDYLMIELIHITYQMLGAWLQRYFGNESDEIRSKLISGVTGNVTMETNKRLWDLAQSAKASPTVCAVLRGGGPDLRAKLEQTKQGQEFLVELDRFLAEYGHREVRMDILYPTWIEDPAPVLAFVRRYLDVPESQSPQRQQERLVKQREELALTVQARLQQDLFGRVVVWPIFRTMLRHTQKHARERDTMHFEFTRVFPPFRRLLLEMGRRWTTHGFLAQPEDIFFLTLDEITQLAESPHPMQETVKERRAELEHSRSRPAPSKIRDGAEVMPESAAEADAVEGQLRGIAGSPGTVKGIARVIRGPEEFDKLQNGDILVAPLTNPVWTPLFAIAGGLVTEVGGILSHGAIVAREYGIPAVMAVPEATHALQDGQRLTVDGNKGVVYVEAGGT
jgi:phosphoenolpyruvate synthase/pyruvate phosphate dikinase